MRFEQMEVQNCTKATAFYLFADNGLAWLGVFLLKLTSIAVSYRLGTVKTRSAATKVKLNFRPTLRLTAK